ncbi:MAG: hypothetical protein EBW57_03510 [Candidatus Fonsibacter ubiquis]|nr:hypothetical protein [Candidatus Fonsibacter ubiquis]
MKKIHPSKISYYARNKRLFLSNPRYKSMYRIKTKPTFTNAFFNTLIKEECSKFLKENGEHIKKENPALYKSITGKTLASETSNKAELEKARAQLKKNEVKINFVRPQKDWSKYGGWVNAYEPVNKGRLGSTQEWKKEKPYPKYY